jgi:hypothetical protein
MTAYTMIGPELTSKVFLNWMIQNSTEYESRMLHARDVKYLIGSPNSRIRQSFENWLWEQGGTLTQMHRTFQIGFVDPDSAMIFTLKWL